MTARLPRCTAALTAVLLLSGAVTRTLAAQDANIETMAALLAAEDSRSFDESMLRAALADPDSSIRTMAALSAGRLRDSRAIPLLLPLLRDRDSLTQAMVLFALGLIGDSAAAGPIIERARDAVPVSQPAAMEMITAMARIGGSGGAGLIRSVLVGSLFSGRDDQPYLIIQAAQESYRLGRAAPVNDLLGLMTDQRGDARLAAVYSLGRLRIASAAPRFLDALQDRTTAAVRAAAARSLTSSFADSARLDPAAVADALARAIGDQDAGVRVNALRSLGGFKQPRLAKRVIPLTEDPVLNVQVQAAQTLGDMGGPDAVAELARIVASPRGNWARRREALLGLAAADSAAFAAGAAGWSASGDWRERAVAATGAARWGAATVGPFLLDRDPKVVAAALQAWSDRAKEADPTLLAAARKGLASQDAGVRAVSAEIVGHAHATADIPALVTAYKSGARDSFPDAALAVLTALNAIGETSPEARLTVDREALAGLPRPTDYLIREWAEQNWTAASRVWGPAYPIETGRTMEDYRDLARRFLVSSSPYRYPVVKVEVDQLGTVELELFGPEAPLTVANFLRLVNRRYFDGQRFHRVVPNFVVQTGDPRGDGMGGPGGAIRDEINRRKYQGYIVGMALSGPDTGGSQWFITLSSQPHLDGGYTVFGRVSGGEPVLQRITQGDLIRTIRP
jgi:cyclophilin family peptidyl-prolyl cis-trans isomerase/HEAT repeat protein